MEEVAELKLNKKISSNLKCQNPSHNHNLEFICLDPKCNNKRLICSECHKTLHITHEVMHYNVFIQLCKDKTVQLKNLQFSVEEELKKSEIIHIENLNVIKDNIISYINQVIEKQTYPFFEILKQKTNTLINPDIINTAIVTLSETMEKAFDYNEINNQLEIITQNLTYTDDQLGLKLQFGPGIFTSKIINEINSMTDNINSFHVKARESFLEKINHLYAVTFRNIEELSKKMDEITEKTDFNALKLITENMIQIENGEITTIHPIGNIEKNDAFLIALGFKSGRIKIFNLETKTQMKDFFAHEGECIKIFFMKESNGLFSSGMDQKLAVWNICEGFTFQTSIENPSGPIIDMCSISDDKLMAIVGGKTLSLVQYNLIKLTSLDFEDNLLRVSYINSIQTNSRLVCGDFKGNIYFVDIIDHGEKLKLVYRNCNVHNGCIENIFAFEKKDLIITIGYGDKKIVFHNANNFQQLREVENDYGVFQSFYDPIDEVILLDFEREEIAVLNLQSEKVEKKFNSLKTMGNYLWVQPKKSLICSIKDQGKNFLFLRNFD